MEENGNLISRSTYKHIKSLNRLELSKYLSTFCDEAVKEYGGIDLNELRQVIGSVNGVGEKRLNELMNAITEHYGQNEEKTNNEDSDLEH